MSGDKHEARHEDLQQQLEEQQTAVDGAKELLEEGGDDPELQTMLLELLASLRETEGLIASQRSLQAVVLNRHYRFRHTDGRWHHGVAIGKESGRVLFRFTRPTKPHMLSDCLVDPGLVKAAGAVDCLSNVELGTKVLASSRCGLYLPAELVERQGEMYKVLFTDSGDTGTAKSSEIACSAYASNSSSDDNDSEEAWVQQRPSMEACGDDRMDSEVSEGSEEADSSEEEAIVQGRQQSGFHASTSQSGSHAETVRFGSFEEHTRGIGSKLMVGMGYVKGAALGRHPGGQLHPIQVDRFRPGAGLGSDGAVLGSTPGSGRKKRSRGGAKRRVVRQKFQQREARRQAELRIEQETGELGVFALVNKQLGDHSEAAKIQQRSQDRQGKARGHNAASKFPQPGIQPAPQDRKQLVASQDSVASKKAKIAHLQSMQTRNQKDAVMAKQIKAKLHQAEAELGEILRSQQNGITALLSQEKQKKWLKF